MDKGVMDGGPSRDVLSNSYGRVGRHPRANALAGPAEPRSLGSLGRLFGSLGSQSGPSASPSVDKQRGLPPNPDNNPSGNATGGPPPPGLSVRTAGPPGFSKSGPTGPPGLFAKASSDSSSRGAGIIRSRSTPSHEPSLFSVRNRREGWSGPELHTSNNTGNERSGGNAGSNSLLNQLSYTPMSSHLSSHFLSNYDDYPYANRDKSTRDTPPKSGLLTSNPPASTTLADASNANAIASTIGSELQNGPTSASAASKHSNDVAGGLSSTSKRRSSSMDWDVEKFFETLKAEFPLDGCRGVASNRTTSRYSFAR